MSETAELPLTLPEPEISPAEIEALLAVLREAGDWMTAKEIAARMSDGTSDREVRAIASAASPRVVSFPGSKGYKLWQRCTVEEINHAIEAFESQGRDMFQRAVKYRRAYHNRYRTGHASDQAAGKLGAERPICGALKPGLTADQEARQKVPNPCSNGQDGAPAIPNPAARDLGDPAPGIPEGPEGI